MSLRFIPYFLKGLFGGVVAFRYRGDDVAGNSLELHGFKAIFHCQFAFRVWVKTIMGKESKKQISLLDTGWMYMYSSYTITSDTGAASSDNLLIFCK